MDSSTLRMLAFAVLGMAAIWWFTRGGGGRAEAFETYDEEDGGEQDYEDDMPEDMQEEGFADPQTQESIPGLGPMARSVDLLPKPMPQQDEWSEFSPAAMAGQNFLTAQRFMGTDTKGSTLKNANYDLRMAIPVPKTSFVWNNSTIDADVYRRPLEGL